MTTQGPTIARIALGSMIASLREAAGKDQAEVAAALRVHQDTVRRWESGQNGVKVPAVIALAHMLGASPAQLSRMTTLADQAKERGAVERYPGGASPEFRMFADFEPVAQQIWSYEPEYLPGLVQTPEYLHAIHEAQLPSFTPNRDAVQGLRRSRHATMFGRKEMPELRFLIGAGAMVYLDALPSDVRDPQVEHLHHVDSMPTVDVRVITRMHSAMSGGFTLLTPADGAYSANRFAYLESQDVCRYIESPDVVSLYDEIFRSVWDRATPLKEYVNGR